MKKTQGDAVLFRSETELVCTCAELFQTGLFTNFSEHLNPHWESISFYSISELHCTVKVQEKKHTTSSCTAVRFPEARSCYIFNVCARHTQGHWITQLWEQRRENTTEKSVRFTITRLEDHRTGIITIRSACFFSWLSLKEALSLCSVYRRSLL